MSKPDDFCRVFNLEHHQFLVLAESKLSSTHFLFTAKTDMGRGVETLEMILPARFKEDLKKQTDDEIRHLLNHWHDHIGLERKYKCSAAHNQEKRHDVRSF